jgi:hypothetical protein
MAAGATGAAGTAVVRDLVDLTRRFVDGRLAASEFDGSYRRTFAGLPMAVDGARFDTLEELALACSDYVEDPSLRDEPGDLGEAELLTAARAMLERLQTVSPQDLADA